jgi:cytosine/adenosine deaminase-related metal-dependent hydrolase
MVDTVIVRGRWVVTGGGAADETLMDGAVVVAGDTVAEVASWADARKRYPDARVIGSDTTAVLPGLVNGHHHSGAVTWLQHGIPDDVLEPWILSLGRARAGDAYLDTMLSVARLLRTGVTAVVDFTSRGGTAVAYADRMGAVLRAHDEAGIRAAVAGGFAHQSHLVSGSGEVERFLAALPPDVRALAEGLLPRPGDLSDDDYLGIIENLHGSYRDHPRLDVWFAPSGPQWASDAFLQRIAEAAGRLNTGIQTHVLESFYEKLHGPRDYRQPTVLHLRELGVLGPRFTIAHGVWVTAEEIAALAETGTPVSHNPSSNLRLRAGVAPLNALLAAGVTVAVGMDGTTLNDDEDMFTEIRLAARLARTPTLDGPAPAPERLLEAATAGGAALMGKAGTLGRIAPGYAADLAVLDLKRIVWPWVAPETDPRRLLVMRARAGDVDTVLVGGEVVLEGGRPTRFDAEALGRELADRLARTPYPEAGAAAAAALNGPLRDYYRQWVVPDLDPYAAFNSCR